MKNVWILNVQSGAIANWDLKWRFKGDYSTNLRHILSTNSLKWPIRPLKQLCYVFRSSFEDLSQWENKPATVNSETLRNHETGCSGQICWCMLHETHSPLYNDIFLLPFSIGAANASIPAVEGQLMTCSCRPCTYLCKTMIIHLLECPFQSNFSVMTENF